MRTGETAKVSAEENRSITRKLQLPTKKHKRLPLAQNRRAWAVSRLSPRAVPHARRTRQRPRRRPHHRHSSGAVAAARTHPGPRSGNQHAGRALRKPLHEISGRLSRPKADRLSERELRSLASPAPRDFCSGDAKAPERHGNSGRARDAAIGGGSKPPMLLLLCSDLAIRAGTAARLGPSNYDRATRKLSFRTKFSNTQQLPSPPN